MLGLKDADLKQTLFLLGPSCRRSAGGRGIIGAPPLMRRFGGSSLVQEGRIRALIVMRLEALGEVLLDFTASAAVDDRLQRG